MFLLFELNFGRSAHLDNRHTTGQLGLPLLKFLTVKVRGGLFNLGFYLLNSRLDCLVCPFTLNNGGLVLVRGYPARPTQVLNGNRVQFAPDFLGDYLATDENGHIFEHRLAAVAKSGCLHGEDIDGAAQLVHHQSGQSLPVHVFRNQQQVL